MADWLVQGMIRAEIHLLLAAQPHPNVLEVISAITTDDGAQCLAYAMPMATGGSVWDFSQR